MVQASSIDLEQIVFPLEVKSNPEHFFQKIAGIAPSILYIFDLQKMENVWANRSLFNYLGYTEKEVQAMGAEILQRLMHPEDFERYPEHFTQLSSLGATDAAKFEYRMQHKDGHWVWLHSHEAPYDWAEDGTVSRIIGSAHDISELKDAAAQVELISSELRHRVNNIFSVVGALISMTGRRTPSAKGAFAGLAARLSALAEAHQLAFQDGGSEQISASDLLKQTLAPYRKLATVSIETQEVRVPKDAASSIALILHELATNAIKYGGLRTAEGKLDITLQQVGSEAVLEWHEQFLPSSDEDGSAPKDDGFGTQMIDLSVKQLDGAFSRDLSSDQLSVSLRFQNHI